jgi:hypothetical protein
LEKMAATEASAAAAGAMASKEADVARFSKWV